MNSDEPSSSAGLSTSESNTPLDNFSMAQLKELVSDLLNQKQNPSAPSTSASGEYVAANDMCNPLNPLNPPDRVNAVAPKPSPIWTHDVELWFGILEAQFANAHVTKQCTKFYTVVGVLTPELARTVSDVIRQPPANNAYDVLKQALIARLGDSSTARIKKVLSDIDLGDRKPSQLLREMLDTAGDAFPEETLRILWDSKLPSRVRSVIACCTGNINQVAELADKVVEACSGNRVMEVTGHDLATSTSTSNDNTSSESQIQILTRQNLVLQKQILELSQKLSSNSKINYQPRTNSRSRSTSRSNFRSNSRSSSRPRIKDGICWYHYRWGDKAIKCSPGCSKFNQSSKN